MAILYTTLAKEAHAEQTIERSRFISHASPAFSREEAEAFIERMKSEYRDASSHIPAFVIGDKMQLQWGSDGGEPQGTGGAPIVQMLVKEGLTNVVIVVTRYFGGIKLGTGGLVRAFTSSAKLAIDAAGRHDVREMKRLRTVIPYSALGKLQNSEKSMPFEIAGTEFLENVGVILCYEPEDGETVMKLLTDMLGGKWISEPEIEDTVR